MLLIVIFIVVLLVLCIAVMNGNSDNTKLTSPLKPQSNISRKNSNVDKVEISIEEAKELSTNPNAPLRMATDVLIAQDRGEKTFFIAPSTYKRLRGKQGQYKQFTTMKSPISQITKIELEPDEAILAESEIPAFCQIGNLIFEKKYHEAIEYGLSLLEHNPTDCGAHVNLMDAYFKARNDNPQYLNKSTYHARLAILYGHHTGYAEDRLAKNLDRAKYYHQSLQLYDLILRDDFHFSPHGCGDKAAFAKRRNKIFQKIDKALDSEKDILFTLDEISIIIKDVQYEDSQI